VASKPRKPKEAKERRGECRERGKEERKRRGGDER
jgi:hypothetical protein